MLTSTTNKTRICATATMLHRSQQVPKAISETSGDQNSMPMVALKATSGMCCMYDDINQHFGVKDMDKTPIHSPHVVALWLFHNYAGVRKPNIWKYSHTFTHCTD